MMTLKEYSEKAQLIKKYFDSNPCPTCAYGKGCVNCVIDFIDEVND